MDTSHINQKTAQNVFDKFKEIKPSWFEIIDKGFLSKELKKSYKKMLDVKFQILTE